MVRADVYRPDFVEPPFTDDGIMVELDLDRVDFNDNDGDGVYLGLYDNFNLHGLYRFVIYGTDRRGDLISPTVLEVEFDSGVLGKSEDYRLYLPVIQQ